MISIDTNILLKCTREEAPGHRRAKDFLESLRDRSDVAVSEFVLAELYVLLRNQAVVHPPLDEAAATGVIGVYRRHPTWALIGFPARSQDLHSRLWKIVGRRNFARRRIFDVRLALTLQAFGVSDFATTNVRDFDDLGFRHVWNPLEQEETP